MDYNKPPTSPRRNAAHFGNHYLKVIVQTGLCTKSLCLGCRLLQHLIGLHHAFFKNYVAEQTEEEIIPIL